MEQPVLFAAVHPFSLQTATKLTQQTRRHCAPPKPRLCYCSRLILFPLPYASPSDLLVPSLASPSGPIKPKRSYSARLIPTWSTKPHPFTPWSIALYSW